MNVKRPWLHEVDAATALFVRQHAVHADTFEQNTVSLSNSSDGTLWKVDRYEFDQVYDQALDDVYRSVRRQATDIFSTLNSHQERFIMDWVHREQTPIVK